MSVQYIPFKGPILQLQSGDAGLDLNGRLQPENEAFEGGNPLTSHLTKLPVGSSTHRAIREHISSGGFKFQLEKIHISRERTKMRSHRV